MTDQTERKVYAVAERAAQIADNFIVEDERDERDNARNATARLIASAIRATAGEEPPHPEPERAVVEGLREAIERGLLDFCLSTQDFVMSSAMRRSAADYILARPEAYKGQSHG